MNKPAAPKKVGFPLYRIVPTDSLVPYANNSRTHSPAQIAQLADLIREFGFTNPVLTDGKRGILAGHARVLAAKRLEMGEIPTIELKHLSAVQKRAYVIADNKAALNAGWDSEMLQLEFGELEALGFDVGLTGFSQDEFEALMARADRSAEADNLPPVPVNPISRAGDVWLCGPHRIMCGDSLVAEDVERLMIGRRAQLMHADPPYGMGKEADGVLNDNLYGHKLDAFQMRWWLAYRRFLDSNASAYLWGNAPDLWRLWYVGGLADSEPLTVRNEIVWDKKSIAGMASPELTQFPEASERCLFFQIGRYVFLIGQTKDDYWPGWEPIRKALVDERDRAGFTNGKVKTICGNHMAGHWFGTSQWCMISRENWDKLAEAAGGKAFTRPFDELRAEYDNLAAIFRGEVRHPKAEDFRAGRPYFDNAHDTMRDVWEFGRVTGEERYGHATPKPVAMVERMMLSSLRKGELVIEPFAGSGSTVIGAEKTGRVCYAMELAPEYVDVTVRRWQDYTGKQAINETTGEPFPVSA